MRLSINTFAALLTVYAIGSASTAAQEATPSRNLPPGFSAPEMAGRYLLESSHDYGKPSLGVSYEYLTPIGDSCWATLYLYQRDESERALSVDSVIKLTVGGFKEALAVMRQRGDYDEYKITAENADTVRARGGWKIPGYHLTYTYRRKSTPSISHFYFFVAGNALLKVRATAANHWVNDNDLPDFAHEVLELAAEKAPRT